MAFLASVYSMLTTLTGFVFGFDFPCLCLLFLGRGGSLARVMMFAFLRGRLCAWGDKRVMRWVRIDRSNVKIG